MTDARPTHLDLFSGIGGFALAAEWAGFRTVGFCEIEPYAQRVLAENFKAVPDTGASGRRAQQPDLHGRQSDIARCGASIHPDIFALNGTGYRGVSLLTGGFPCQPFSVAGKRRGAADDRHLWPEMLRVIAEARPAWVLGENVPGIATMEFRRRATRVEDHPALGTGDEEVHVYCESTLVLDACVRADLESIGYAIQPFAVPACGIDARHLRDRIWIVAHDTRLQPGRPVERAERERARARGESGDVSDHAQRRRSVSETPRPGANRQNGSERPAGRCDCHDANPDSQPPRRPAIARGECCEWLPEPDVGRKFDGLSAELDKIRLKLKSHKLIMAYAKNSESIARETLRTLRDFVSKENVQWAFGGCSGVSPQEILLSYLRQLEENEINEARIQLESAEASRASLRGVRSSDKPARAPSRSRHQQQCAYEHPDSLQTLSRLLAQHSQEAWQIDRWQNAETVVSPWSEGWEVGLPRVSQGIPNRVDRLKGLGNSIVPQVAYEILREIRALI